MNLYKIIEYAVYHDNLNKKYSLPGIKNGMPVDSFFNSTSNLKLNDFESITSNIVEKSLKKINNINLFCSGGVDSSILVHFLTKQQKKFLAIHNYYPNHNLNDLNKLKSLNKFFKFKTKKILVTPNNYLNGMKISFDYKYYGNTYAPTLYHSMYVNRNNQNKIIMTGSGPDELFYGMEKYDLNFFKKLSNLNVPEALEKIDTNYNEDFYLEILNSDGKQALKYVKNQRRKLYQKISKIKKDLLEAQRLLSYCTVSNQHFEMFEKLSRNFRMKHISPFFDKNYIKFAFSKKLTNFLSLEKPKIKKDSNTGKKQLKKMLASYTSYAHAYDNKIGFHAPISKLIERETNIKNFKSKIYYEKLEKFIDIDKLNKHLEYNMKYKLKNYNLYSILNLQEMIS